MIPALKRYFRQSVPQCRLSSWIKTHCSKYTLDRHQLSVTTFLNKVTSLIFNLSKLCLDTVPSLDGLYIVGWVQPLPPFILHPSTPTLIILILDLQELLAWNTQGGARKRTSVTGYRAYIILSIRYGLCSIQ